VNRTGFFPPINKYRQLPPARQWFQSLVPPIRWTYWAFPPSEIDSNYESDPPSPSAGGYFFPFCQIFHLCHRRPQLGLFLATDTITFLPAAQRENGRPPRVFPPRHRPHPFFLRFSDGTSPATSSPFTIQRSPFFFPPPQCPPSPFFPPPVKTKIPLSLSVTLFLFPVWFRPSTSKTKN